MENMLPQAFKDSVVSLTRLLEKADASARLNESINKDDIHNRETNGKVVNK